MQIIEKWNENQVQKNERKKKTTETSNQQPGGNASSDDRNYKHSRYLTFKSALVSGVRCGMKESLRCSRYSRESPPPARPRRCLIISLLYALSCGHCEDTTPEIPDGGFGARLSRRKQIFGPFNYRLLLRWWIHALGGAVSAGIQTTTQLGFSAPPENCT